MMTELDRIKTLTAIQNLPIGEEHAIRGLAVLCSIVGDAFDKIEELEQRLAKAEKTIVELSAEVWL